ncbi:MAG: hypothetical protein MUO26_08645 [Methanotrichaceae archaeon]|nr:hypothetical protein [Methanotrichaceae archaeon]
MTLSILSLSNTFGQPAIRPDTGTLIKDVDRTGYGTLVIHNNWRMDTVAVLADQDIKPLIAVYIQAKGSLNITEIDDGNYNLYFTIGNLWNPEKRIFDNVFGYYRYNMPLIFETSEIDNEIEYSIYELDLYEAKGSNFVPDYFEFPDLR